jgi:hypothetical protein
LFGVTPHSRNTSLKRAIVAAALGILITTLPSSWAEGNHQAQAVKVIPFSTAQVRIEVNATDEDSGFHVLLDAEGWKWVKIFDPKWRVIFEVEGGGSVRKTGLTELFFESAEPGFDELPLDKFLDRFPAGDYLFLGRTLKGDILFSRATLTHALPEGPILLSPPDGSEKDPSDTEVSWLPVADPPGGRIVRYEVIVSDESFVPTRVFSAVVPATVTSMKIPTAFLLPDTDYKYEVLAIDEGGNQTLSEAEFSTGP